MDGIKISVCTSSMSTNTVILFFIPRFPRPSQTCSPLLAPLYDTIGNILEIYRKHIGNILETYWKYIGNILDTIGNILEIEIEIYYDWKLGVQLVFDRMSLGCGLNYSVKKQLFAFVFWQTRWRNKREITNREISWVGESTLNRPTNGWTSRFQDEIDKY